MLSREFSLLFPPHTSGAIFKSFFIACASKYFLFVNFSIIALKIVRFAQNRPKFALIKAQIASKSNQLDISPPKYNKKTNLPTHL